MNKIIKAIQKINLAYMDICHIMLIEANQCPQEIIMFSSWTTFTYLSSGRGADWKRACFGSRTSGVQIPPPRPIKSST